MILQYCWKMTVFFLSMSIGTLSECLRQNFKSKGIFSFCFKSFGVSWCYLLLISLVAGLSSPQEISDIALKDCSLMLAWGITWIVKILIDSRCTLTWLMFAMIYLRLCCIDTFSRCIFSWITSTNVKSSWQIHSSILEQ